MQYFRSLLVLEVACVVLFAGKGGAQEPGILMSVSGAASTLRGFFYTPAVGGQYWQIASTSRGWVGPVAKMPGNRHLLVLNSYGTAGSTVNFSLLELDTRQYLEGVLTVPAPANNFMAWFLTVDQEGEVRRLRIIKLTIDLLKLSNSGDGYHAA